MHLDQGSLSGRKARPNMSLWKPSLSQAPICTVNAFAAP